MKLLFSCDIPRTVIAVAGILFGVFNLAHSDAGDIQVINTISPKNGAFQTIVRSTNVFVSTTPFTNNLGPLDFNLQHAMQTLDQLTVGASTASIKNQNTLQAGSTFYVSSGSVAGQLTAQTAIFTSTMTLSGNVPVSVTAPTATNNLLVYSTTTQTWQPYPSITDAAELNSTQTFTAPNVCTSSITFNGPVVLGGTSGTSGYIFTSNGAGQAPTWQANAGGSGGGGSTGIVAVDSVTYAKSNGSATNLSWNHTIAAANEVLLIGVNWRNNNTQIPTLTYNGVNQSTVAIQNSGGVALAVFQVINPPTGTKTIVASLNVSSPGMGGEADSFTGINVSTPTGTAVGSTDNSTTAISSTETITIGANGMGVDFIVRQDTVTTPTLTKGANQTQLFQDIFPTGASSAGDGGPYASSTDTVVGSTPMSWTWVGGQRVAQIAIPVNAGTSSSSSSNILNQNTLQSGATFYVSSGSVAGQFSPFTIKWPDGTIQVSSPTAGGGGGWVGTATSDLNMNNFSIKNINTLSTKDGTIFTSTYAVSGAAATVAVDSTTSASNTSGGTSLSWTHTIAAANELLEIGVVWRNNNAQIPTLTYNSVSLSTVAIQNSGSMGVAVFQSTNPATGAHTIAVTISPSATLGGVATSFTGISVGSPIGSVAGSTDNTATATMISDTITIPSNGMGLDFVVRQDTSTTPTLTPGSGQGQNFQGLFGGDGGPYASSTKTVTGAHAMMWSWVSGQRVAHIAIPINSGTTPVIIASSMTIDGPLILVATQAATLPLRIQANAAQASDLTDWQDSSGNNLSSVNSSGNILSGEFFANQAVNNNTGVNSWGYSTLAAPYTANETGSSFTFPGAPVLSVNQCASFPFTSCSSVAKLSYTDTGSGALSAGLVIGNTNVLFPNVNTNGSVVLTSTGSLRFNDLANSHYVSFKSSATNATNNTYILPSSSGTAGQALLTDGLNNLYFGTVSGGGSGINNQNTLQAGATFYVSSGTVNGQFVSASNVGTSTATIVRGAASQSADLQEWQTSSGAVIASVGPQTTTIRSQSTLTLPFEVLDTNGNRIFGVVDANGTPSNIDAPNFLAHDFTGLNRIGLGQNYGGLTLPDGSGGSGAAEAVLWGDTYLRNYYLGLASNAGAGSTLKITNGGSGLGALVLGSPTASTVALVVKGAPSQSVNLQEWQNSSAGVLSYVDKNGYLAVGGGSFFNTGQSFQAVNNLDGQHSAGFYNNSTGASAYTVLQVGQSPAAQQFGELIYINSGNTFGGINQPNRMIYLTGSGATNGQAFANNANAPIIFAPYTQVETFRFDTVNQTGLMTIPASSLIGLSIKGASSQSADLQEWQNSSSSVLSYVDKNGYLAVSTNTLATTNMFQVGGGTFAVTTNGHLETKGTLPTVSSCGTSPSVQSLSTDTNGFITTGSGIFTSCTLTFANAYANKPSCVIEDDSTVLTSPPKVTTTTTTMIVSGVTLTPGDVINYICFGNQ